MSIQIVDTFLDIEKCFTHMGFNKQQWNQYMNLHLPYAKDMIEKDAEEYDFEKEEVLNLSLYEIENVLYACIGICRGEL